MARPCLPLSPLPNSLPIAARERIHHGSGHHRRSPFEFVLSGSRAIIAMSSTTEGQAPRVRWPVVPFGPFAAESVNHCGDEVLKVYEV